MRIYILTFLLAAIPLSTMAQSAEQGLNQKAQCNKLRDAEI